MYLQGFIQDFIFGGGECDTLKRRKLACVVYVYNVNFWMMVEFLSVHCTASCVHEYMYMISVFVLFQVKFARGGAKHKAVPTEPEEAWHTATYHSIQVHVTVHVNVLYTCMCASNT